MRMSVIAPVHSGRHAAARQFRRCVSLYRGDVADQRTIRALLWPTRVLVGALVAIAAIILVTVHDGLGAVVMEAVLGGLAVWIVRRPGVALTNDGIVYRPFFRPRKKIGWDHVTGFSVVARQGRPGSTINVIAANTSGEQLLMWALMFHSVDWTTQACDALNREATQRRRRHTTNRHP